MKSLEALNTSNLQKNPFISLIKLSLFLSFSLPVIVNLCYQSAFEMPFSMAFFLKTILIAFVLLGFYASIHWLLLRFSDHITRITVQQATYLDSIPSRYLDWAIVLSAFLSLFLELAVIRWQSEVFPIFAFFKNFSLLACFIGLGLGYSLAKGRLISLFFSLPLLVFQIGLLRGLRFGMNTKEIIWRIPFVEQFNMGMRVGRSIPFVIAFYTFLGTIFLLTVLAFIPVGQLCGRLMARRENLRAYGLNLLGSFLGVLLITALSAFWTPPVVWFSLCFAGILSFQFFRLRVVFFGILVVLIGIISLTWPVRHGFDFLHSPYQLIELGPGEKGFTAMWAAGLYYQRVHDLSLSNANRARDPILQKTAAYYELPYQVYGTAPKEVLVVGAGMGNDVAAALRSGASEVEAIEIDPAILKLGMMYHPEKPYANPRVRANVNDARTFLRRTGKAYDMIIYGLLDSHTLLSHTSSVRLDSFVYTIEAFREARQRLKSKGILSLSFAVLSDEIGRKIYLMLQEAFDGVPPVCIRAGYDFSVIFLQSREGTLALNHTLLESTGFKDVTSFYANPTLQADVSTDDWPFFYMPQRVYPVSYLSLLGLMFFLTMLITLMLLEQKPAFSHIAFFLLGAGFMLIETKAITELGLTFGNTWHVIGIVIGGIMLMSFLANCVVQWFHIQRPLPWFGLLLISILLGFIISTQGGLGASVSGKFLTLIVLTCPMFFSGVVFSCLLGRTQDITGVMAVNLLGAMTGGILEYNSMYFGFRFLYLLALGIYVLAMFSFYMKKISPS